MIARIRAAARRGEDGMALLLVMGSMATLSLFLLISMGAVVSNAAPSRAQQDSAAASAAAQAGVEEYLSRLNVDDSYWTVDNTDATNTAFTAGSAIPGLSTGARFSYKVLDTVAAVRASGVLHLEVTGTSRPGTGGRLVSRKLTATLKTSTSTNYAYFSDYEAAAPALYTPSDARCGNYWAATSNPRSSGSGCQEVQWNNLDTVTGPIHTNDSMLIAGRPTFTTTTVESSAIAAVSGVNYYRVPSGGSYTANKPTTVPVYAPAISSPYTTTSLLDYATQYGCVYTGVTQIAFTGTSGMTVRSPYTTTVNDARCLTTSNRANAQALSWIPPVVYVKPTASACTFPAATSTFTYPATGEVLSSSANAVPSTPFRMPAYDCAKGNAYVQGPSSGTPAMNITVVAQDDVDIMGNLPWSSATTGTVPMLGLISGANTWVYNPVKLTTTCSGLYHPILGCLGTYVSSYDNLLTTPIRTVNASVLAVNGSFVTQNWNQGDAFTGSNKLTVTGSVAQHYRGPMATGTAAGVVQTGYNVAYALDSRLATSAPPYFLRPAQSPWTLALVTDG